MHTPLWNSPQEPAEHSRPSLLAPNIGPTPLGRHRCSCGTYTKTQVIIAITTIAVTPLTSDETV